MKGVGKVEMGKFPHGPRAIASLQGAFCGSRALNPAA
jgi:hypothetical protein